MIEAYGGREALAPEVDAAHAITPADLKFAKHPPCFLSCGEWDPLCASNDLYAKRLTREGHKVQAKTYAKATHGYFNFPEGDVKPPAAATSRRSSGTWKRHFSCHLAEVP